MKLILHTPLLCRQLTGNFYGTPSASHTYFKSLSAFLQSHNNKQSTSNQCFFFKHNSTGPIFISITVDDFLIASRLPVFISQLYNEIKTKYHIRRLRNLSLIFN
eukprot:gb/GEZJ01005798.1/.p1 GENE.gb/GEZJ01005798.1/~~gb/GEZJ01005798.1/.p1  ORF type:complete len:104 (+),score=4.24 gb/GEZJ01005798.1/:2756-3067(+)